MQSEFASKLSFITLNFACKDCKVFIGTSCKSNGDRIIDVDLDDQKLDKQEQPLAAHFITKWENWDKITIPHKYLLGYQEIWLVSLSWHVWL